MERIACDVLILGGGVAGLCAAHSLPAQVSACVVASGAGASNRIHGFSAPMGEGD